MEEKKQVPEEDREKVDKFWDNPLNVLHLIDLLFIEDETRPKIVS